MQLGKLYCGPYLSELNPTVSNPQTKLETAALIVPYSDFI
jgi:hypothetical protein